MTNDLKLKKKSYIYKSQLLSDNLKASQKIDFRML